MFALTVSLAAAALMLTGACIGAALHRSLAGHHLNEHVKDIVRLGSSLLATIVALVLGLLITSAKHTYDEQRNEVRQIAAKLVLMDGYLKRYGPEARRARELSRQALVPLIDRIWGQRAVTSSRGAPYQPSTEANLVYEAMEALNPQDDVQRNLKFQALATMAAVTEARVRLFEEADSAVPMVIVFVLTGWLTILFAGFTLFSPINRTGSVVLTILALSAASALFLILELSEPFSGLMQISSQPLREALGTLAS